MAKYLADVRSVLKDCGIKANDGRSALEVYEEYYEKQTINKVFHLIDFGKKFDISFHYADFKDKPISGYLKGKQIVINKDEPLQRQRFTTAHELGHFFYQHDKPNLDIVDLESLGNKTRKDHPVMNAVARNGDINPDELEANEFAGALLMPKKLVTDATLKWDLFGVSEIAWNVRISNINRNTKR